MNEVTVKIVKDRAEIVKAVRENATVFVDCMKEEDRKLKSSYAFVCLAYGKHKTLNAITVYRDTYHMDNKRNTFFHTEVCFLSAGLSFEDLEMINLRNTLKVVNAGDTITIVGKLRKHLAVMTVRVKAVTDDGKAVLDREDAQHISGTIFEAIDMGM